MVEGVEAMNSDPKKAGNPDIVTVYLVLDAEGTPIDCKLTRAAARGVERQNPAYRVQRSIARPAPRGKGGA